MANVNKQMLALKEGEKVFNIGELLKLKDQGDAEIDELFALGEGKGLPFEFKEGEIVEFPKFEECDLIVRISKLNGKEYKLLSTIATSNMRGEIEVPISIFRRTPAIEADRKRLVEGSALTEQLLQNNLSDIARLQIVSSKSLIVSAALRMAKVMFKLVSGRTERVDVESLPETERKSMLFYQVKFA